MNKNKIVFILNRRKQGNYAFFEPLSSLHVTLSNPTDAIPIDMMNKHLTAAVLNGTIININDKLDDNGELIKATSSTVKEEPEKKAKATKKTKETKK